MARGSNHEDTKNTKKASKIRLETILRVLRFFVVCINLHCFDSSAETVNSLLLSVEDFQNLRQVGDNKKPA